MNIKMHLKSLYYMSCRRSLVTFSSTSKNNLFGYSNYAKRNVELNLARNLGLGSTTKDFKEPTNVGSLTKYHAQQLALRLTVDEREILFTALQEFESKRVKEEYEAFIDPLENISRFQFGHPNSEQNQLAANRWRSKLGRPTKVPSLGDVDPTGTYCPVPEDWLKKKYAATVPRPTSNELFHLFISNAIPFIGFGFLDNFIMIVAGDSIEHTMGVYITLSTMAAAALGNTLSDIIGIGSAMYIERAAALFGITGPKLSPVQVDMPISRRVSNLGRVIGITIGCFLGMIPLLFKDDESPKQEKKSEKKL